MAHHVYSTSSQLCNSSNLIDLLKSWYAEICKIDQRHQRAFLRLAWVQLGTTLNCSNFTDKTYISTKFCDFNLHIFILFNHCIIGEHGNHECQLN